MKCFPEIFSQNGPTRITFSLPGIKFMDTLYVFIPINIPVAL